jgi:hypothetical protein
MKSERSCQGGELDSRSAVKKASGKVSKTAKWIYCEGNESDVNLVKVSHCFMSTSLKCGVHAIPVNLLSL